MGWWADAYEKRKMFSDAVDFFSHSDIFTKWIIIISYNRIGSDDDEMVLSLNTELIGLIN